MVDLVDNAIDEQARILENSIRMAKIPKYVMHSTGECHWCQAPLDFEGQFCDSDCRDDWQKSRVFNNVKN